MIWSHEHKREITLAEFAMLIMAELQMIRKEIRMDFTNLNNAITQLAADVKVEVAAATAAILAAQANPADVTNLANAVTSLNAIDAAVTAASAQFTGTNTTS